MMSKQLNCNLLTPAYAHPVHTYTHTGMHACKKKACTGHTQLQIQTFILAQSSQVSNSYYGSRHLFVSQHFVPFEGVLQHSETLLDTAVKYIQHRRRYQLFSLPASSLRFNIGVVLPLKSSPQPNTLPGRERMQMEMQIGKCQFWRPSKLVLSSRQSHSTPGWNHMTNCSEKII